MRRIYCTEITILLEQDCFYYPDLFTFDYKTKRILYKEEVIEPKLAKIEFARHHKIECSVDEFKNAIYYFARKNTPIPNETYELLDVVSYWLLHKEITETTVRKIIESLSISIPNLTDKQISKCLSQLGWKRKRTMKGSIWYT